LSARKIANDIYSVTDPWIAEVESKNIIKVGWYAITFTNIDAATAETVAAGSSIDVAGTIYQFDNIETPTGTSVTGTNYLKIGEDGVTSIVQTVPTFDFTRKGHYNGAYRYILQYEYNAGVYSDKMLLDNTYGQDYGISEQLATYKDSITESDLLDKISGKYDFLQASDRTGYDSFGISSDMDGDYIIFGAESADVGSNTYAGAGYIYHKTAYNTWGEEAKITALVPSGSTAWGRASTIQGDYAAISTTGYDSNAGGVVVYHQTGGVGGNTWTDGFLISPDVTGNQYGEQISLYGDYLAVGAKGHNSYTGGVYIYHRTAINTWEEEVILTGPSSSSIFGISVSMYEDRLAVGSPSAESGGLSNNGTISIYKRSGTSWNLESTLSAPDAASNDQFGYCCDLKKDQLITSSFITDGNLGAAYVFEADGDGSWNAGTKLVPASRRSADRYGQYSCAIGDDYCIVPAPEYKAGTTDIAGAVYIFYKDKDGNWGNETKIVGSTSNYWFGGRSVAINGIDAAVGVLRVAGVTTPGGGFMYIMPLNNWRSNEY
jgi:hypothetical protein